MDEYYNHHYITVTAGGLITGGWSDGPHPERDTSEAVCISEHGGYQFRLSPGGEENPALYDFEHMIPLYRWDGAYAVPRGEDEIAADIAAIPAVTPAPTQLDRVEAQAAYTALMTDTLLEV